MSAGLRPSRRLPHAVDGRQLPPATEAGPWVLGGGRGPPSPPLPPRGPRRLRAGTASGPYPIRTPRPPPLNLGLSEVHWALLMIQGDLPTVRPADEQPSLHYKVSHLMMEGKLWRPKSCPPALVCVTFQSVCISSCCLQHCMVISIASFSWSTGLIKASKIAITNFTFDR